MSYTVAHLHFFFFFFFKKGLFLFFLFSISLLHMHAGRPVPFFLCFQSLFFIIFFYFVLKSWMLSSLSPLQTLEDARHKWQNSPFWTIHHLLLSFFWNMILKFQLNNQHSWCWSMRMEDTIIAEGGHNSSIKNKK